MGEPRDFRAVQNQGVKGPDHAHLELQGEIEHSHSSHCGSKGLDSGLLDGVPPGTPLNIHSEITRGEFYLNSHAVPRPPTLTSAGIGVGYDYALGL
eukprot:1349649-Amphidinium_carterae.1